MTTNKFDITKHKWSYPKNGCETHFKDELWLSTDKEYLAVKILKDDAIAIAKHFGLINDEFTIHHRADGGSIKITDDSLTYSPPVTFNAMIRNKKNQIDLEITGIVWQERP